MSAKASSAEGTTKRKKGDIEAVPWSAVVDRLATKCQLTQKNAKEIADSLFQIVEDEITSGKRVSITGAPQLHSHSERYRDVMGLYL